MIPLFNKNYDEPSVFTPENLLREARRQKNIANCDVPEVCVLDPDGDLVSYLVRTGQAQLNPCWACYHTQLFTVTRQDVEFGVLGNAVGASFAVLVAEELFVSGCTFLISITSAGIIMPPQNNVQFVLIEHTLRDEGTSFHYLPPDTACSIQPALLKQLLSYYSGKELSVEKGRSWTTDAPFRENKSAIDLARKEGVTCVEMEASALYAFAKAKNQQVACFAHLTNTMAQTEGDFEKGEEMGSLDTLRLIHHTIQAING